MKRSIAAGSLACLLTLSVAVRAGGQTLPAGPLTMADGRVVIGGDVSASTAPTDNGFFNYTDYEHTTLRLFRVTVTGSVAAGRHVTVLGEVRSENADKPRPYALYVRVRPWVARGIDVEAGLVPPVFGAYSREVYAADNLLIGYPLAYQYLTSLRADALPASADDLLRMRGRGWLASYPIGNTSSDRGVPLVSAFRWDTGVQVHAGGERADATIGVTTGSLSEPRVTDNNGGKQIVGRVSFRPATGLVLGASAARGAFVSSGAAQAAGSAGSGLDQTAWGADAEYSRGYYLVRAEAVFSRWRLPRIRAPYLDGALRAAAVFVEGQYRISPGLYAAARFDHLGFSEITGTSRRDTWDAPVTRVEIGGGYSLQRNLLLKASYQHDSRDGGRVRSMGVGALQLVYWF
jgi:hypothetical protein